MKIITLLPVKNEEWILEFSLRNFELFSDEIVILDDHSTDKSREIAARFRKVIILPYTGNEMPVDMSKRRILLLDEGRKRGGTHFVMLDADETFSKTAVHNLRPLLQHMKPGEVLLFPWLFIQKKEASFVYDKKHETNYKDFVFCDDKVSSFAPKHLSEDRTPGNHGTMTTVPFEKGYVLHLQNIPERRNAWKQAWYRCNELLEGRKSARRINATYSFTKAKQSERGEMLRDTFLEENKLSIGVDAGYEWYKQDIMSMFKERGIVFFETLDIWHIHELQEEFLKITGRKPMPLFYPPVLIKANKIKNKIRNFFR